MKTLAAVLVEQRQPLELEEVELPNLSYGQVLVEVLCSGICGSQLGEIAGVKGPDRYLPHLLGHEGCGTVLEIGPGVKRVQPGDRVVLHWRCAEGIQSEPPVCFSSRLGKVNAGWVTTFSRHTVVSENRLTPVRSDTDPFVAALMGCAVTTGMGVVVRDAGVAVGESVLILGAGGVGLSTLQAARLAGAFPVVCVDRFENRLELAARLGADRCLTASEGTEQALLDTRPDDGYDVVVESTGQIACIEMAYRLAGPRGRVVLVGVPPSGEQARFSTLAMHFGKRVTGSHGGDAEPTRDIPRYLRLYEAGRLPLRELISQTYELTEVNEAIRAMRDGELAGRCLLTMKTSPPDAP